MRHSTSHQFLSGSPCTDTAQSLGRILSEPAFCGSGEKPSRRILFLASRELLTGTTSCALDLLHGSALISFIYPLIQRILIKTELSVMRARLELGV